MLDSGLDSGRPTLVAGKSKTPLSGTLWVQPNRLIRPIRGYKFAYRPTN